MSYILDALKKSEQKRQQGQVPDLSTVAAPPVSHRAKPTGRGYLLAAVLLIGGAGLGYLLRPGLQQDVPVVAKKAVAQQGVSASGAASPAPREEQSTAPQSSQVLPVVPPQPSVAVEELPSVQKEPAVVAASLPEKPAPAAEKREEPVAEPPEESRPEPPAAPVATAEEVMPSPPTADIVQIRPEVEPEPETAGERIQLTMRNQGQVLDRSQLPASIRNQLPELRISAHFFAEKPASRLASINGRIVHEGDSLNGLDVQEITPDGVVLGFASYRFLVPVF